MRGNMNGGHWKWTISFFILNLAALAAWCVWYGKRLDDAAGESGRGLFEPAGQTTTEVSGLSGNDDARNARRQMDGLRQ